MKSRLMFLLLTLLAVGVASAQEAAPPAPVLMLVNGSDIWASGAAGLTPLTSSGYTDRPVLSPNATRIAYKVIADIGVQALQTTGGLTSELPSDIEILDLGTGIATRIATQPPDATFNTGEPARAIVRSAPAWSPDGTMLAWTEDVAPEGIRRLVVHRLGVEQPQVLAADLPRQAGFQQTLPVRWSEGGIALRSIAAAADAGALPVDSVLIYGTDGTLQATAATPAQGEYIYDIQWIDENGVDKVGILYSTGRWDVVDPASGTISPLVGSPELYSRSAPDGLSIVFGVTTLPDVGAVFTWRVGETPLPFTGPLEWISIAPTGDALAFADGGAAYIWRDGVLEEIFGTNSFNVSVADIVWGPTAWRTVA